MWKTNKWVPEWVVRHAIAHLHPGLQPPCRCAISIMEGRWHTGWKPVPSKTGPAVSWPPMLSQTPIYCPCILSWKQEILYVILLSNFWGFFKSQRLFFSEHLQCVLNKYLLLQLFLWAWVTSPPIPFTMATAFPPHWLLHFSGIYSACFCLGAFTIFFSQPKTSSLLLSQVHCLISFRFLLKCTILSKTFSDQWI